MPEQLEMFTDTKKHAGKGFLRLPDGRFCNRFQRELAERDRKIAILSRRNTLLERQSAALIKANTVLQRHAGVNTIPFH